MRFVKCIIGADYKPVGFVYEDNGIERYEDFASLCRRNASDGKLYFSDSGVFGLYKNSENEIEICRETVGGGYSSPIDPGLTLTQRIVSGGKVVGYVVKDSTGRESKKHLASILSASKYMKPVNYMIVETNGIQYPRGKGVSLTKLPTIDITPSLTTPARPKTVRTEPHDVVDPRHSAGASVSFIAEKVEQYGGVFLKLPEDKYTPVGGYIVEDGSDFTRLTSVCEIAYPAIEPASKKLSASLQFKVPGSVLFSEGATLAYIYRKKNIVNYHYVDGVLRGDKVRLGRVVIVLPKQHEAAFYQDIAGTIAVESMAGTPEAVNTAMRLIKMSDPVFLSVDLTNIPLIEYGYEKYLLAGAEIKAIVDKITAIKYVENFTKKFKEGYRLSMPATGNRLVWDVYSNFSSYALAELSSMGVDISNGVYTPKFRPSATANKDAVVKEQDIEVEYETDLKFTVPKEPLDVYKMTETDLPDASLIPYFEDLFQLKRSGSVYRIADSILAKNGRTRKSLERKLFYHKVAMLMDGNNTVHAHDKNEWSSASVRSNAQFTKFTHTSGVSVKLRNILIN